ncbi:MAG TPA: hypothetical protein VN326_07330 [Casimicrobiaceae bacterium]|nr:hypothetical protein [Casimicrobiaceae bacterium]
MEIENLSSPDDGVDGGLPINKRRRRVAVIAIHGVADQKLGDTCQVLAELLIAQTPNGFVYEPGVRQDEILQVKLVEPLQPTGTTRDGLRKQLRQSTGSDFLRQGGTAAGEKRLLAAQRAPLSKGADYTDYLLAKAKREDAPIDTYTAPCIAMTRRKGATADQVDIHEMYWADLSRLSGLVPRILTELFTLLFRLSSLGRDTVQVQAASEAYKDDRVWRVLASLQTCLDFAYSRILALLFLQLVMLALILVPFGLLLSDATPLHQAASVIAGMAAGLWYFYRARNAVVALAIAAVVGVCLWIAPAAWVDGLVWIALLSLLYDWWMRVCEERFTLVRPFGWILWIISIATVIVFAARATSSDLAMWVWGALSALEVVLLLIVIWWTFVAPIMLVWLGASIFASRRHGADAAAGAPVSVRAKSSVATGRTGLFVSLGFFIIITMTAWALVTTGVERAVEHVPYHPILFKPAPPVVPGDAIAPGQTTAGIFLDERFVNSTSGFSVIALLLFPLVLYLVLMLLPSVLAELGLISQQFGRLGRWLTGGYRELDRVSLTFVAAAVAAALLAAVVLVAARFSVDLSPTWFGRHLKLFGELSKNWLNFFVISAGTATIALTAAGGVLSRYVPWLRAPLDAALDVDNHFREFPRRAIPRARIFSRYVALLKHVAAQNYERIVIVSHSQGTVISADLLRYLKERAADAEASGRDDEVARLWRDVRSKTMLVTAGCPLRQLYAARFPEMYDWVLRDDGTKMGPAAADVGVTLWVNVYTTGDYVGRWLWSRTARGAEYPISQIDEIQGGETYTPANIDASDWRTLMGQATGKDVSIGAGAHTHYFAPGQVVMASIVDALIAE